MFRRIPTAPVIGRTYYEKQMLLLRICLHSVRSEMVCRCHGPALVRRAYRIPKAGAAPMGKQQITHLQSGMAKLRLRAADGAVQQFGDLAMLVPVDSK